MQVKLLMPSMQVAPLWHGSLLQSLMSETERWPRSALERDAVLCNGSTASWNTEEKHTTISLSTAQGPTGYTVGAYDFKDTPEWRAGHWVRTCRRLHHHPTPRCTRCCPAASASAADFPCAFTIALCGPNSVRCSKQPGATFSARRRAQSAPTMTAPVRLSANGLDQQYLVLLAG